MCTTNLCIVIYKLHTYSLSYNHLHVLKQIRIEIAGINVLFSLLISVKHLVYIWHIRIHPALEITVLDDDDCGKGAKTPFF